jgi:sugar lactone lactonase YvrE
MVSAHGQATTGPPSTPVFNGPFGIAFDRDGNLYVTDRDNHRIRRVDSKGIITNFAGDGNPGFLGDNVAPNVSRFSFPSAMMADAAGNLVIADSGNGSMRARKITFPLPPPVTAIRAILNAFGSRQWFHRCRWPRSTARPSRVKR